MVCLSLRQLVSRPRNFLQWLDKATAVSDERSSHLASLSDSAQEEHSLHTSLPLASPFVPCTKPCSHSYDSFVLSAVVSLKRNYIKKNKLLSFNVMFLLMLFVRSQFTQTKWQASLLNSESPYCKEKVGAQVLLIGSNPKCGALHILCFDVRWSLELCTL